MKDILTQLASNKAASQALTNMGMSLPPVLKRFKTAWPDHLLAGKTIAVKSSGPFTAATARSLLEAGAECYTDTRDLHHYRELSEALARPVHKLSKISDDTRLDGLLFDASQVNTVKDLEELYAFFNALLPRLKKNARLVVVRPREVDSDSLERQAALGSLEGFTRSLAKETGAKGTTVNLVIVEPGAEERLRGLLPFLLSDGPAFVDAQVFELSTAVSDDPFTAAQNGSSLSGAVNMFKLHGKTALVTGAARGIGAEIARVLAAQGAHVVCLDRPGDDPPLSKVAAAIDGSLLLQDISQPGAAEKISTYLTEKHGGVDIVIHNAGITRDKTLKKMPPETWQQVLAINLQAVINISDRLDKDGVLKNNGRVVCLSSIAGLAGNFGQTNYGTSKAGVAAFVKAFGRQTRSRGIAVNAIAPGFIETRMTAAIPLVTREAGRRLSNLNQGGLPSDVAQVAAFLSTPAAAGLNGNVIRVCGGNFLGR